MGLRRRGQSAERIRPPVLSLQPAAKRPLTASWLDFLPSFLPSPGVAVRLIGGAGSFVLAVGGSDH